MIQSCRLLPKRACGRTSSSRSLRSEHDTGGAFRGRSGARRDGADQASASTGCRSRRLRGCFEPGAVAYLEIFDDEGIQELEDRFIAVGPMRGRGACGCRPAADLRLARIRPHRESSGRSGDGQYARAGSVLARIWAAACRPSPAFRAHPEDHDQRVSTGRFAFDGSCSDAS